MSVLKHWTWTLVMMAIVLLGLGSWHVWAETAPARRDVATVQRNRQAKRVTQAQREAAAERAAVLRAKKPQALAEQLNITPQLGMAMPMPGPGAVPHYFGPEPNWAFSPALRKFVDTLPLFNPEGANNLGQYLPVAKPDTITYPGSDYYELSVRQYSEKLHTDLPPTLMRGYVQTNMGTDAAGRNTLAPAPIHYLGPVIVAQKDRPVRIKFTNELPTGEAGNLFIPVDTSVMGAGMGPLAEVGVMDNYTQNRATIHLHGGRTPWISDGTPHQWITPAGETTPYPKGDSVSNVPDMPDPGKGAMTFYLTNQQSARLMFYHDHAFGITRLNVYAGMAAGYLITDQTEQDLLARNVIPTEQIPLIIQDKTFVDAATIETTDPTWNWGSMPGMPMTGDLWMPHVYVPAQNPFDIEGVNATGRWAYGPWFWPPTNDIVYGPVPNPYYDPMNNPAEPPEIPGVPHPSMGMESFFDTPLINGTAFPTLTVEPKAYRFRILNASNDRFWNLQLYTADPTTVTRDSRMNTEVVMVPATATAGFPDAWPTDGREGGVPDPATMGPDWIQIGTEGGFLPMPAVVPQQPITWNNDPTTFNAGNVQDHSLLIAPAERADVIVDFSQYAGKTLILYNDAPAAFPALDPRYDYYTGSPDLTDTGGYHGTEAGFGPNTRTIMQIKVADLPPAPAFDLAKLETEWASTPTAPGVFSRGQDPLIVGQAAYNTALNTTFSSRWPDWGLVRIQDNSLTFKTLTGASMTLPLQPKALQDEMGEAFDHLYGRMSGKLGLERPMTTSTNQNFTLLGYADKPTEILNDSMTPLSPVLGDGTQIWKITHNGVDTHPLHFHLFDVQVINRVGWDGAIRRPDANELGWKDTVRVSPLEDTIVAMRPVAPKQPFGIPDSIRLLDPTMPVGSMMGFTQVDPLTGQPLATPVTNQLYNFGWEYMWHCHILSHEEMEMMRPISFNVARRLPDAPVLQMTKSGAVVTLNWTDATPPQTSLGNPANEIGFVVERSVNSGPFTKLGSALANATRMTDTLGANTEYAYRVYAYNAAGNSPFSNTVTFTTSQTPPGAPLNVSATPASGRATVTFTPPSSDGGSPILSYKATASPGGKTATGTGSPLVVTGLTNGMTYTITVTATNALGTGPASAPSNSVTPANVPGAPRSVSATAGVGQATVTFAPPSSDGGSPVTGYTVTSSGGQTVSGTASPLTVTGLTNGQSYTFTVTATNAIGTGPASAPSNSITPVTVPGAPQNAVATAGNSQLTVTFAPPASDGGSAILSYTATASPGGRTATGAGSPLVITGLTNGTAYTVTITATNALGTGSASAPSNSAIPATVPGAPQAVTAAVTGSGQVTVSFSPPASNGGSAITGYTVTSSPGGKTATGTANSLMVTGLTNGTTYTFTVTARNVMGTGPASSPSSPMALTVPAAPTSLTGKASAAAEAMPTINLAWLDKSANETGFTLQRALNSNFTSGLTSFSLGANSAAYLDAAVLAKTRYYYRIFALNGLGQSAFSNAVSVLTPVRIPAAPTNLAVASATRNSITLRWTDNSAIETGFRIQRSPAAFTLWTTVGTVGANVTTFTNGNLLSNFRYRYRVQAYNADGSSPYTAALTASTTR